MRFSILLFASLATSFLLSDPINELEARGLTTTLTQTAGKAHAPKAPAPEEKKTPATKPAPQVGGNPKQSALGQTIAAKSRLLNPDINNKVEKDLAKEAQKNQDKALKHAEKHPDGGYTQAPLVAEERRLDGKAIYPTGQKLKDHLTKLNPFADPSKKAAAKDRILDGEYHKSPQDIAYENKRNKLAGADNERNKNFFDRCRNKKAEFDDKTKKLALGLQVVSTATALKPRHEAYLRRRIVEHHLLGRELLRRQECA